jgi:hypothetical protein
MEDGSEFAQGLRPQPRIELRRQKERDHRRVPDIGIEQVLDADRHAVADTGTVVVRPGFLDASGIEVHSHPSRPEFRPA